MYMLSSIIILNLQHWIYLCGYLRYLHTNIISIVTITRPPRSITVCRGSDVTVSCGYGSSTALPVTWIINKTSFTQQEVWDSPLYQLNNHNDPNRVSLTVFSINDTTTFQCIVHSTPNTTTSRRSKVTVTTGTYVIHNVYTNMYKVCTVATWIMILHCEYTQLCDLICKKSLHMCNCKYLKYNLCNYYYNCLYAFLHSSMYIYIHIQGM